MKRINLLYNYNDGHQPKASKSNFAIYLRTKRTSCFAMPHYIAINNITRDYVNIVNSNFVHFPKQLQ